MDVVIPAGGTISAEYARRAGTTHRALAPIGPTNVPMMQHVVNALQESGHTSKVIAVAEPEVSKQIQGVDVWIAAEESGPANILRGLASTAPDRPTLLCASDLPLLTPKAINDFVRRANPSSDLCIGLVRAETYLRAYPGAPPSQFVSLKDVGDVTISCLFRVNPAVLLRSQSQLEQTFNARKSQWRTAALFGPGLVLHWMRKTLTLGHLITLGETRLQCRIDVLYDVAPELAFDIDTVEDYEYAHARFRQNTPADPSAVV